MSQLNPLTNERGYIMADTDEVHELCNTTKVPSKTTRSGFEVTFDPVFLEKKLRDIIANERREAAREFPQWVKDNCSHSVHPAAERHNAYTVYVNDVDEFLAQLQPTKEQPNE